MKRLITNTLTRLNNGNKSEAIRYFYQHALPYLNDNERIIKHIRSLTTEAKLLDNRQKESVATLCTLLYDMLSMSIGHRAAYSSMNLTEPEPVRLGYCASEWMHQQLLTEPINFSSHDEVYCNDNNVLRFLNKGAVVCKLSEEHKIYCYKELDGSLVMLGIIPVNDAVLCDEESFQDEAPLYFTENSHFVSPIYMMDIATALLRELMVHMGYPYLRVREHLLFPNKSYPINIEDMRSGDWKNRDMILSRKSSYTRGTHIKEACCDSVFPPMLMYMLYIVGKHIDKIRGNAENIKSVTHDYFIRHIKPTIVG